MHMTAPGMEHWKVLEHLLGYLKYNYKPLKFQAPKELYVISIFDGDWAADKNDRRSISSYLTTIGGMSLVTWQSKKQQTVTLSSCESETMGNDSLCSRCSFYSEPSARVGGQQTAEAKLCVQRQNVAFCAV
jgi:hypothetical protein